MMNMNMNEHPIIPKGLKKDNNPLYKDGQEVVISADHMPGMYGAKAVIDASYKTDVYSVNYFPNDGSKEVFNHKWVVENELLTVDKKEVTNLLKSGQEVILNTNHMEDMLGAKAIINESIANSTVYMINYFPTDGSSEVKNHMWVVNSEVHPRGTVIK